MLAGAPGTLGCLGVSLGPLLLAGSCTGSRVTVKSHCCEDGEDCQGDIRGNEHGL